MFSFTGDSRYNLKHHNLGPHRYHQDDTKHDGTVVIERPAHRSVISRPQKDLSSPHPLWAEEESEFFSWGEGNNYDSESFSYNAENREPSTFMSYPCSKSQRFNGMLALIGIRTVICHFVG